MRLEDALEMVPEIIAYSYSEHAEAIRKIVESLENYKELNKQQRRELLRCRKQIKQLSE